MASHHSFDLKGGVETSSTSHALSLAPASFILRSEPRLLFFRIIATTTGE